MEQICERKQVVAVAKINQHAERDKNKTAIVFVYVDGHLQIVAVDFGVVVRPLRRAQFSQFCSAQ